MMTSMHRYLLLTSLVCHSPLFAEELPRATAEDVGISSERLAQITEFTQRHVDEGKHAGLVTIVARHGKVVHFEAVGNYGIDNDKPMEKDTLFRIFSMTKPVTSVAIMMLYEEGKFHMGDPVSNFIPAFGDFDVHQDGEIVSTGHEVTIEQLLTHTAGLTYGFFPDHEVDQMYRDAGLMDAKNLVEFMQILSLMPLKYEPGTRYHYSVATDVLGALVEVMSKQTLDDFFHERIFVPLGMNDTFFDVPDDKLDRQASNHVWNYEEDRIDLVPKENGLLRYRDVTLFSGGGGLVSTAMDYMIFCEMLRSGGTYNGVRAFTSQQKRCTMLSRIQARRSNSAMSKKCGSVVPTRLVSRSSATTAESAESGMTAKKSPSSKSAKTSTARSKSRILLMPPWTTWKETFTRLFLWQTSSTAIYRF